MERCLYTYVPLNENDPPDAQTATPEHIVPYALGGCDPFTIRYCSKKANNDFGSDIDAPFIALPLVGFKRHTVGIKSYSGIVPDIVFRGQCVELQKPCNIVFPYQGAVYADFPPEVTGGIDVGQISFGGNEERLRGPIESLIKKANRKGRTLLGGAQLEPIATFDEAVEAAVKSTGQTLHFRMNLGWDAFTVPWTRGIVKMALGLGAYALGRSWAFSAAADALRSCLVCSVSSLPHLSLRGTAVGRLPDEIARMLDIQPGRHTLAVLPYEKEMVACISLFGGELFDGIINLGDGPADIRTVNETLPKSWECVFHIDPATRTLTTRTLADVDRARGLDE
jgi:hypothetical protein